ncbi:Hypothetical_protein [Hexamita inflata]|uniref:Hypothetical_protein n=1 Tax=Hexamita inflata TaxID=28002 RepID=A0AA86UBQ1_9EUKA|nr:Hypothetical protein HINF_LOCUS39180 [Hexamita inflata]
MKKHWDYFKSLEIQYNYTDKRAAQHQNAIKFVEESTQSTFQQNIQNQAKCISYISNDIANDVKYSIESSRKDSYKFCLKQLDISCSNDKSSLDCPINKYISSTLFKIENLRDLESCDLTADNEYEDLDLFTRPIIDIDDDQFIIQPTSAKRIFEDF